MKRSFASMMLAALIIVPAGGVHADPPLGGDPNAAQTPAPPQAAPNKPAELGLSPDIFGNQNSSANVVQPGQPRGQLGGLASGAPGVAGSLQQLNVTTPVATQQSTVVTNQTAVVGTQAAAPVNRGWMVSRVIQHCIFRSMYDSQMSGQLQPMPVRGFGPFMAPPIFDLELLGVGMVSDMAGTTGPIYRVSIRNNSLLPVHHFRVSLIAVQGQLQAGSPVTTVDVGPVSAGATGHIDIQLPIAVMNLGPQGQAAVPFDTLVAAIDSFDELPETNELNNVTTMTRVEIAVVTTTTAVSATTTMQATTAAAPAMAGAPPVTTAQAPAVAPTEQTSPPQNKVDLDNVDLNMASGTSQLFSR